MYYMKDYQLPPTELKTLRIRHRKEKNKKNAYRLNVIYLLGKGWAVSEVKEALMLDENSIYRYYDDYKKHGIEYLLKNNYKGSVILLTNAEVQELKDHLEETPCRTTKEAIFYVEKNFDVTYSISGMNGLLKKLGFTYKKPHPIPGKSNNKEQEAFVKMYKKIRRKMNSNDSLFFIDGVHPHHNPLVQYGWFKKGIRYPLKTNTRYNRINVMGAVDIDRYDVVSQDFPQLNEEATLDFLEKIRKKRANGWIYLVLDNAGYYSTNRVKKYAEAIGIRLLYLPPYSPNLNLVERLWGFMQKQILYNKYYATFAEFKQKCKSFLNGLRWKKDELRSLLTENFERLQCC